MKLPTEKSDVLSLSREQWRQGAKGLAFGSVIGIALTLLGINDLLKSNDLFLPMGAAGALLGLTRVHTLLPAGALLCTLLVALVACTPLTTLLTSRWDRSDTLSPTLVMPAVVVLSSHVQKAQTLDSHALERTFHGYELLREGHAQELVITEATLDYGSQAPIVRAQMRTLGLNYPLDTVGPVRNTHDEALAVAQLAKQRHWTTVLLVTHPWHMRRSAAVFEKAGVHVICAACTEGSYDLDALKEPWGRLAAFRDWLHEVTGYQFYRLRGWL